MIIVASQLSEALERERLTSSFFLQGMNVTVYTFEAVKTTFLELFCSPKGSHDVFLWRFYQCNRARRGSLEMVR